MSNLCKFCHRPFTKVGNGQVYCKREDCVSRRKARIRYVRKTLGVDWRDYAKHS